MLLNPNILKKNKLSVWQIEGVGDLCYYEWKLIQAIQGNGNLNWRHKCRKNPNQTKQKITAKNQKTPNRKQTQTLGHYYRFPKGRNILFYRAGSADLQAGRTRSWKARQQNGYPTSFITHLSRGERSQFSKSSSKNSTANIQIPFTEPHCFVQFG